MSRPALTALPSGCGCPHPASRTTVPEQPETKPSQLWAKGILMSNTAPTARRQQRKRGDADKAVQGDEDVTHQFSQGPGTEEMRKKPRREGITRCAGLAMRMGSSPSGSDQPAQGERSADLAKRHRIAGACKRTGRPFNRAARWDYSKAGAPQAAGCDPKRLSPCWPG